MMAQPQANSMEPRRGKGQPFQKLESLALSQMFNSSQKHSIGHSFQDELEEKRNKTLQVGAIGSSLVHKS